MKLKLKNTLQITSLLLLLVACTDKKQQLGNQIVFKIESFKKTNGYLPNRLEEIGVTEKEEGPIYYTKQNDSVYIVYYGRGLGESMVYNSAIKRWQSDHQ